MFFLTIVYSAILCYKDYLKHLFQEKFSWELPKTYSTWGNLNRMLTVNINRLFLIKNLGRYSVKSNDIDPNT